MLMMLLICPPLPCRFILMSCCRHIYAAFICRFDTSRYAAAADVSRLFDICMLLDVLLMRCLRRRLFRRFAMPLCCRFRLPCRQLL